MPAADRVIERRALLLEAGLELLGTRGVPGTTVRGVCAAAQLNARYFYESFPDLDALIGAVFDDALEQLHRFVGEAMKAAGTDHVARIRAMVTRSIEFADSDRRRARVLFIEGRELTGLLERRTASSSLTVGLVADAVAGERPGHPSHRASASFLVGGLSELIVRWLDGQIPLDREELTTAATELCLAAGRVGAQLSAAGPPSDAPLRANQRDAARG